GWVGVPAGEETLETQPRMPADDLRELADSPLRQPAAGLERQGLRPEAELEHELVPVFLQGRQERFVDVGSVDISLGWPRAAAAGESGFHLRIADNSVVDVRG